MKLLKPHPSRVPAPSAPALSALLLTALWLSACSLAGDVTPPPGVDTGVRPSAPQAAMPGGSAVSVSADSFPSAAPSTVQGAAVYAAHCESCHGATGRGDGEKAAQVMTQRTEPMPDFSTPDRLGALTPGEMYQTVTQGRLDKFMPPFADVLTEAERWSAIAYLYSLSAPITLVDSGQGVFEAQCASCHAPGQTIGDPKPTDFADQAYMAGQSQAALIAAMADHKPALETQLDAADTQAVMAYARTLSFSTAQTSPAVTSASAPAASETGALTGNVTNGTQGAALPADLAVVLRGYDNFNQAVMLTATVAADGAYAFKDVPVVAGRQFMVTTDHAGLSYSSDIFNFEAGPAVSGLALTIYDDTTDASALRIERMHVSATQGAAGSPVDFSELVLFTNLGDRTLTSANGPVIDVPLPTGATAVVVQGLVEGSDYVRTADGIGLLWPVRPGPSAAQLTVTFQLPADAAAAFNQTVKYPVQALDVMVGETLTVSGDGLQDAGLQTLQDATVHAYAATDIAAGEAIAFSLSAPSGVGGVAGAATVDPVLIVVGVVGVLAAAGVGLWGWRRRSAQSATPDDGFEDLLQAIADLDDDFADGVVQPQAYHRQRARLKAQLVARSGSLAAE